MADEKTPGEVAVAEAVVQDPEAANEPPEEFFDGKPEKTLDDSDDIVADPEEEEVARYPMREVTIKLPFFKDPLKFNWLVSVGGIGVLWGVAIFCMTSPDASTVLKEWYDTTIQYFTWFYMLGNPVMTFFIFWVAYRYGHIKLGPQDGKPEFSDASYFAMLFSAGVGVGLFVFGVAEPLAHQTGNYYTETGYRSQNEIDQWALNITMYHWGFAAWSPYLVMAISAGLGSYVFGLPLTVRSSFYPMLGHYCWGWIGDLIDAWSIVMTIAGVCTSLGLGTIQLAAGMTKLGWIDPGADPVTVNVTIIWVITFFATISVVSGLKVGIKILSVTGFCLGCVLLFLSFAMEKSYYLLNVLVQTTGFYLQWCLFQVPFWTDAFGGLKPGEGAAVDGNAADPAWMGWWPVFYMAWWVAWACFVGLFIARISKNRTLRSIIIGVFAAPTIYALIWFSFMGGIGIRQQRQALELEQLGVDHYDNIAYFQSASNEFCYDVPQNVDYVGDELIFSNTLPGITPVCKYDPSNPELAWFNVMFSFSYPGTGADGNFAGFGQFMSGLSIFTLGIYFITSSDSGSLVVDTLASNGAEEHHWLQRVFWAFTEGAVATGLLVAGGNNALSALQTASIVFGLPFNFFIFLFCWSIQKMCATIEEHGLQDGNKFIDPKLLLPKKTWEMPLFGGIFNTFEFIFSFGAINEELGVSLPTSKQSTGFFKNLLFPFAAIFSIYGSIDLKGKHTKLNAVITGVYAICHVTWIALFVCGTINYGFIAFGWMVFFMNACILTTLRMDVRGKLGIGGNVVGDFVASSFLYPQALLQIELQLAEENYNELNGEEDVTKRENTEPLQKRA